MGRRGAHAVTVDARRQTPKLAAQGQSARLDAREPDGPGNASARAICAPRQPANVTEVRRKAPLRTVAAEHPRRGEKSRLDDGRRRDQKATGRRGLILPRERARERARDAAQTVQVLEREERENRGCPHCREGAREQWERRKARRRGVMKREPDRPAIGGINVPVQRGVLQVRQAGVRHPCRWMWGLQQDTAKHRMRAEHGGQGRPRRGWQGQPEEIA